MAGTFKKISDFLSYREPNNEELGFELLEDESEDSLSEGTRDRSKGQNPKANHLEQQSGSQSRRGRKIRLPSILSKRNQGKSAEKLNQSGTNEENISPKIEKNLEIIKTEMLLSKNFDIIIREFNIGRKLKAFMVYIEGMVKKDTLNLSIFPQLMSKDALDGLNGTNPADFLIDNILTVHKVEKSRYFSQAVMSVLNGMSALFVDGCRECIIIDTKGFEKRSVDKPVTETVIKGPQEGFTENMTTNVTLVRKIIKNRNLVSEMITIGSTNNANCAVMYLEGVANPVVVQEVKKRLKRINTDFILGDGMIEQFIEDNSMMLFPQMLSTERPDRTASFIMEGQVVIIADGAPYALAAPVTFFRLFHTSEDTFLRWPLGAFLRLIRIFGLFCATWLPGLYVAVTLYHIEMIPTIFVESIAKAKEIVPFPTIVEMMIMEISFELIREGGIRVPSVVGQTLGIVGALILGQAAVGAGLVSPVMVIIVSITGLGNFVIPNYTLALSVRVERFLFILAGAFLGFYGIALMIVLLALMACSMKSFGVPFFSPVAPKVKANPDVVLRHPLWKQKRRPDALNTGNRKKQGKNVKVWINEE